MTEHTVFILSLLSAISAGIAIAAVFLWARGILKIQGLRAELAAKDAEISSARANVEFERASSAKLAGEKLSAEKALSALEQKLSEADMKLARRVEEEEKLKAELNAAFENLANRIFDAAGRKITENSGERMAIVLNPLKEDLRGFKARLEELNVDGVRRNTALAEQIKALGQMNERLGREAENLAKALKGDNKVAGNWGEIVLERLLESCGLEKGREFFAQSSHSVRDEDAGLKTLRPDIVLTLPDKRCVIIDSKVSLLDYDSYCSAETQEEKKSALDRFVKSVSRHIEGLSQKRYEDIPDLRNPDFVALFMPIEPAYSLLLHANPNIIEKAYADKIVLVTPSTLMGMLRVVEHIWRGDKQQRNAIKIAEAGGKLYDKVKIFLDKFALVGNRISQISAAYADAEKTLSNGSGNIISSAEKLRMLGVKTKSKIDASSISEDEVEEI